MFRRQISPKRPAPVAVVAESAGDISSIFASLSGKKAAPLPSRFADLKRKIVSGKEAQLQESYDRLIPALRADLDEISVLGSQSIPRIPFSSIGSLSPSDLANIRRRGCCVITSVVPKPEAAALIESAKSYISENKPKVRAFPADDPAVYELYWSPSQVAARAHPNIIATQKFLQSLWHTTEPATPLSLQHPITYADRLRIRRPGDAKFALGPHVDGGSLERWEDAEYRRVYENILTGSWESYDAFDAAHRTSANMDLYNGPGSCGMFRMFQGWLSMSETGPGEGTLRLMPALKTATAYLMLRPFFDVATGKLLPSSGEFPGAMMGGCQEFNPDTHPEFRLDRELTMVSVPKVEPGDYVAWHCDMLHSVDKEHTGTGEASVMYIPSTPLCPANVAYLARQRDAALSGRVPPDFPGAVIGVEGESNFSGRVGWDGISEEGKRGLGMERFEVIGCGGEGERIAVAEANAALGF